MKSPRSSSAEKQPTNKDRHAHIRRTRLRQQQRARLLRWIGWGGAGLLLLIVFFLISRSTSTNPSSANGSSATSTIPGVSLYANLARNHTDGKVNYPIRPPVGGAHSPIWTNCGIYTQSVPDENTVHSLEHGAVWITYLPSASDQTIATLQALVKGHDHAILSPYPNQPAPVIITAWGAQLTVSAASDPRLAQFLATYENSPQAPEPNGECTGGVGTPAR